MQVDLNKSEIELLDKALEVWEKDASMGTLMAMMASAMMCGSAEQFNKDREKRLTRLKESENETQCRRVKSVLLRSKLLQALARDSEHSVEEKT